MCLQKTVVEVVYHTELHVSVNEYPERFLQASVFYFSRNLRGEIYIKHAKSCILLYICKLEDYIRFKQRQLFILGI